MERFLNDYPIQSIKVSDPEYPALLKQIPDAPKTIYYRGKMIAPEDCVAIVGTRRTSEYGQETTLSFSQALAWAGLTIVSGMARGIDTFAHQGALNCRGRTIAVLGTGLDEKTIYPQENLKLAKKILGQEGCLISEYPATMTGSRFTFPRRNRIIAGVSLATVVIEAKIKSGALITAGYAQKQNKPVFAVPGSIYAKNSKGCHFLIKNGAKLAESPEDILKILNISARFARNQTQCNDETEKVILEVLQSGSQHIEKIIMLTNLPPSKISASLSIMELDGKIRNLGGNVYALLR